MERFIVVPKVHGRSTSYEVIDRNADKPYRHRLGYVDDEHAARAVAEVLNGAAAVYTATLAALDQDSPF